MSVHEEISSGSAQSYPTVPRHSPPPLVLYLYFTRHSPSPRPLCYIALFSANWLMANTAIPSSNRTPTENGIVCRNKFCQQFSCPFIRFFVNYLGLYDTFEIQFNFAGSHHVVWFDLKVIGSVNILWGSTWWVMRGDWVMNWLWSFIHPHFHITSNWIECQFKSISLLMQNE